MKWLTYLFVDTDLLVDQLEQLKHIYERRQERKEGHTPTRTRRSILIILAVKEYFGLPYRQTEGFTRLLGGVCVGGCEGTVLHPGMQEAKGTQGSTWRKV